MQNEIHGPLAPGIRSQLQYGCSVTVKGWFLEGEACSACVCAKSGVRKDQFSVNHNETAV